MKKISVIFLQFVIVLVGLGVLALMLWEPHFEGRNVNATFFEIYFKDPFLSYAYTASLFFFAALYQAFKLLGFIGRDEAFSERSVKALRSIKYCTIILIAFIVGAEAYFFTAIRGTDDITGGVMLGLGMILIATVAATTAAVFERVFQSGVNLKSGKNSVLLR